MDDTALNERIRHLRKDVLDMSQRQFADALGMAQTSISALESPGGGVSERFIKTVCTMFNVSENWLRTGEGPIYNEGEAFSLDRWAKEHGATELELEIVKDLYALRHGSPSPYHRSLLLYQMWSIFTTIFLRTPQIIWT